MFEIAVLTTGLVIAGGSVWGLICNDRTLVDRRKRLKEMRDLDIDQYWYKLDQFDQVSYDQHLWYRITLRNPDRLYDKS